MVRVTGFCIFPVSSLAISRRSAGVKRCSSGGHSHNSWRIPAAAVGGGLEAREPTGSRLNHTWCTDRCPFLPKGPRRNERDQGEPKRTPHFRTQPRYPFLQDDLSLSAALKAAAVRGWSFALSALDETMGPFWYGMNFSRGPEMADIISVTIYVHQHF